MNENKISRREFIRLSGSILASLAGYNSFVKGETQLHTPQDLYQHALENSTEFRYEDSTPTYIFSPPEKNYKIAIKDKDRNRQLSWRDEVTTSKESRKMQVRFKFDKEGAGVDIKEIKLKELVEDTFPLDKHAVKRVIRKEIEPLSKEEMWKEYQHLSQLLRLEERGIPLPYKNERKFWNYVKSYGFWDWKDWEEESYTLPLKINFDKGEVKLLDKDGDGKITPIDEGYLIVPVEPEEKDLWRDEDNLIPSWFAERKETLKLCDGNPGEPSRGYRVKKREEEVDVFGSEFLEALEEIVGDWRGKSKLP